MRITLQIENVDRLETGGQVSYSCTDRGFDIGRHEHLDWSLPDPQRIISGKHCEVRFDGGQFVLHDTSTNGTFLNGNPNRMDKPHGLRSGDRFMIGDYIISVELDTEAQTGAAPVAAQPWEPAPASPQAAEPGWPAHAPAGQDPAYPIPEAHNPWGAPQAGMEGRHAPPSGTPGIGTPADDVWSQQGHGWGSADPALYDPAPEAGEQTAPRPVQADPLDHLAAQPDLKNTIYPDPVSPQPAPFVPVGGAKPPSGGAATPEAPEPLFGMPDLGAPEPVTGSPFGAPQTEGHGQQPRPADNPFPALEPKPDDAKPAAGSPSHPPTAMTETVAQTNVEAAENPEVRSEPEVQEPSPAGAGAVKPPVPNDTSLAKADPGSAQTDTSGAWMKAFADGAGIPESVLQDRDPDEFARELGGLMKGVAGDLMGLLAARSQVKAMTRNADRTMISRSGNNALKFSPTPEMALQTMLSKSAEANGYLPIDKAMAGAFKDIQKHHVWTYAAMQKAAARLESNLSPKAVVAAGDVQKSTFGNLKAKLWDKLDERWSSLSSAYDDGMVGVFTQYFTENYEELSRADTGETPGR